MRNRPDFIKVNGLVKVNGYVGRILEIAESDHSLMVKVDSAKCARRLQKPDWLDYTAAPDLWEPATFQDLLEDAQREKEAALMMAQAVDRYIEQVTVELSSTVEKGNLNLAKVSAQD